MSIIEQATKRLEELRRAGIEVPWIEPAESEQAPAPATAVNGAVRAAPPAVVPLKGRDGHAAPLPVAEPETPVVEAPERVSREVAIDLDRLGALGYLTPIPVNRSLADELRVIKMQLIKNVELATSQGQRGNLILVTSAVPGEGKTFFSMNLAMSLAMEVDRHALLVDADVLRPSVVSRYGIEAPLGLLDLMTRPELDVADVMLRTNVPKLSLLPAGTPTHKSTELLASAGMEQLLTELSERYADRLVIFDAPPLLVATEARLLAQRVGQVVMVVEANRTDSHAVAQAFAAVESCPLVSSVLNRCPSPSAGSAYGYYEA